MSSDTLERVRKEAIDRNNGRPLWSNDTWQNAVSAYKSGYRSPEMRYPVVISPDSLLASPKDVQRLAGLAETPETITTTKSRKGDRSTPQIEVGFGERIVICDLAAEPYWKLRQGMEAEEMFVWFRGKERSALVYRSLQQAPERQAELTRATTEMLWSAHQKLQERETERRQHK